MTEYEIAKKLRDCLVSLTDGKATERKKQVDNLKAYLIHPSYLHHINKSSAKGFSVAEKGTISITWTKVFNKIKEYIEQECNRLKVREENQNLSSIVQNNIAKDKRSCSDLFRCFVKALKLNKQHEMAQPVVLHILAVLNDSFTQASLGVDYSNAFLKFILYDPFMCLKIPTETLDDAIWFYKKIIKKSPLNWNRSLTTQILLHLITIRSNLGSWECLEMLDFFVHIFVAVKSEKASKHHENLLQCLLLVCQNLKSDYPLRLCDVGEQVLLPIMQLWKTRPSEKIQDLMLEFIRFQLALHHPKGAQKEIDGARAFDWRIWKNHLISMYKLIVTELTTLCERNQYPFGKELILKPALISVAVEVCAQVFIEPIGVLDITQASTSFDIPTPSKKRKIDVSFKSLIDNLTCTKIIPWLQVISAFLIKYSSVISVPEAVCLLDTLIDIHMSCNDIETKNWLLRCCQCFVQAFGSQDRLRKDEACFQWQRLWGLAVKSVALMHQCQEAGHGLLGILLSYKLITPKAEFYNLYSPGSSNRVTKASLKSLAIFLEKFSSSSILGIDVYSSNSISSDNFENLVLEWLFSRKNDDNSPFQVVSDDTDLSIYEMFACVAALLCLQNNECGIKVDVFPTFTEPFQWITEMEDELVFLTFGVPLSQIKSKETKTYPLSNIILQPVWDKILKFFIEATGSIFEEQICNMQFTTISSFIRHSCLLFEMLQQFYFEGIIKKSELESNIFMSHLKRSLLAIMEMFRKSESNSENIMLLKDFMQRIILVINQNSETYGQEISEPFMSQIIKTIPKEMLMYLLNFSLNNPTSENASFGVHQNGDEENAPDDFAEPCKKISRKDEESEFESNFERESFHLTNIKNIPEDFRLQMQCLEIIGQFLHLFVNETYINNTNGFPSDILEKLVSSLPDKDKRFKGASDIHLVLQLLKCILLTKNLDDEVIDKILNTFRLTLNQLSQMQDICQSILKLFPLLFNHIYNRSSIISTNLAKNKSRTLHLMSVLCKKELAEKGSLLTTYHIVENLLRIIQIEPNSSWTSENRTSSSTRLSEDSDLITDSLIKFMNSCFVSIRLLVSQRINEVVSADISDRIFQEICSKTFEFLTAAEIDDISKKDEFSSRLNTFLHYLMQVILHFPCLEIESVFIMLKCIKIRLANQALISKVLEQVAISLGYESVRNFIEPHLKYLCQRWFDAKYKLEEFPFMVLEVNSLDSFIKNFSKILVPLLFHIGDMPSISFIAEKLNISLRDALYNSLPCIHSLLLSDFALNRNTSNSSKCHQLMLSNIPSEICKKNAVDKLDELVVCLLSLLKEDGAHHMSMCQVFSRCSLNSEEFMKTMSYIMNDTDYNGSFAGFLSEKADCIQNIFLSLNVMLHKALRSHESRRILCMYQSFLSLLLPGLKEDLNCSVFVIREIIYSMINFLTDKRYLKGFVRRDDTCIEYCCNIIFCLCKEAVEDFKETVGEFLPFIVSNLTPFASKDGSGKKVIALFKFLLIDCETHLVQYIPYLDPFPNEDFFASVALQQKQVKYRYEKLTLEQEIHLFLKSCKMMGRATKNGLDHLYNQLNTQRGDLHKILNVLKEKTVFTEDVDKSILHELVCQLASICSPDNDFEIQKAASNCLGIIGPVSFSSVVLQPSPHATYEKGHEILTPLQKSFVAILKMLTENIFHKSIHIKEAASMVLKEVLSTKIGYMFFKNYGKHFKNNITKYAYPFFACHNPKQLLQTCKYELNIENLQLSIWIPSNDDHSEWIKNLVCTLLECGLSQNHFYECLVPLCREEASFCEKCIPYLIHMIFLTQIAEIQKFLSDGISSFFSQFSQWIEKSSNDKESSSTPTSAVFPKAAVQTMLSVLHYIWLHPNLEEKNAKSSRNVLKDLWLDINYLDVAQAAQYCSAHFTAILYTELWCDIEREKNRNLISSNNNSDSGSLNNSPLSFIGSQDHEKASIVYDILLDSYTCIGDSDAISGCDLITADSQAILKHSYLIEKKWDGLLKLNDVRNSKLETLQALQLTGLNHTLLSYSQSLLQNKNTLPSQDILEYQCQAAWRISQWDLPVAQSSSHGFQEYFYKSQQSYYSENKPMFQKYLDLARKTQFEKLNNTSLESVRNVLPVLSNMQLITTLEDFSNSHSNIESFKKLLNDWNSSDQILYDEFEFVEPVSWLKCILLNHEVDINVNKHIIIPELKKLLEKHCVKARDELYLQVAFNAVHTLRKLPCMAKIEELQWQMEEAKILWTQKEYSIANKILKSTVHFIETFAKEDSDFLVSFGEALTLRGKWLAETCNENSSVIMRDYLEKAVDVLESSECTENQRKSAAIWDAYLAVARYADAQYQSIVNYKKSNAYQAKLELMECSKQEAKKLKAKAVTEDEKKTHVIISKQLKIDEEELKSIDQDQKQFLNKAISSYLKCLRGTDAHDLWVFRLISLWFQNLSDEETNNIIQNGIKQLQTYKFLPLMYQLAARMGTQASAVFTNTLTDLIMHIAIDHPHHALPVILALSNADKDPVDGLKDSGQSSSQQSDVSSVKDRMQAAKKIISYLSKSKVSSFVKSYSDLCDAYISLAYLPVDKKTKQDTIPSNQPLLKFRNLQNIPIITEEVKIDRTCEYKNLIGIHSFSTGFRMCGGITLPKVIKCLGTDGIEREQLVKGRDDLRQDAVMQQVFSLVNYLLERETETKRRRLHIRTYKVVPVSRRSGVLQWCEGTQVLSQYLIEKDIGAHMRYYPNMASLLDCRKKMQSIASVSLLKKKREIFDSICANYPPVFRYFFLEHFPEPSAWFERRLCYTKSVAASSIVGYILGLGDRHVNNILIDKNTAEVVHIDFGIAFEKGRVLATPETVPFRLTRDIVDGMGISAIEGTFKKCSEKTLEVLRKSQDVLLTILDVLLHDPLYEWTVPPSKSKSQSSKVEPHEVNKLAERALMRLQQKLQGLEEGVAMSIEGQINLLIQQARDPNNLCRLYAGWQPYL